MSWEFEAFDKIEDLHISEEEARDLKFKQLMHLEHILKTSTYNDEQREPIRERDSYTSTLAARFAASR